MNHPSKNCGAFGVVVLSIFLWLLVLAVLFVRGCEITP